MHIAKFTIINRYFFQIGCQKSRICYLKTYTYNKRAQKNWEKVEKDILSKY